jgi:hypothetical protein
MYSKVTFLAKVIKEQNEGLYMQIQNITLAKYGPGLLSVHLKVLSAFS